MSKSHGAFVHQNLRPTHLFLHLGWGAGRAGVSSLPQRVHHSIFPIFIKENFRHLIKKIFLSFYHIIATYRISTKDCFKKSFCGFQHF